MQKILSFFILPIICFSVLFVSNLANAQFIVEEDSVAQTGPESALKTISTFNQAYSVITFFLALLFLIAIIGFIVAAIKFFIAGGSEKVLEEGRTILIYSLTAFILSILGYIMINFFKHVVI